MTTIRPETGAQAEAMSAIIEERHYQDSRWGPVHEHPHEVAGWLTIMRHHLSAAEAAWSIGGSGSDEKALHEVRKAVAVGVACMEQHGSPKRDAVELYLAEEDIGLPSPNEPKPCPYCDPSVGAVCEEHGED